ncbi:MAG: CYTH domain-containing protein [Prolixibacteraceae bacterium]
MAVEIERKFLVDPNKWSPNNQGTKMIQAYLSVAPHPTVRVRLAGVKAFLTIKGRSDSIARPEFEYEIPVADADELFKMAISFPVEKTRYEVLYEGFLWEVDIFSGKNSGLVLAEIELEDINQEFPYPDWILTEVSNDMRYYNSYLSGRPFQEWRDDMA